MSKWISDGSPEISIQDGLLTCTPTTSCDNVYGAMWKDVNEGEGLNSGEYFYKIHFKDVSNTAWVGLSNLPHFKKGYATKGLFYGGNLSDGSGLLVQNFGPRVTASDTVGLLVSFVDKKLQIYFFHNGTPLGLAFDVDASVLPNAWPTVRFSGSGGSAEIEKVGRVPRAREGVPVRHSSVEGPWQVVPQSVKLRGEIMEGEEDHLNYVTMQIKGRKVKGQYDVHLRIVNHISFTIEKQGNCWKGVGEVSSTLMGGSEKNLSLERDMTDLCRMPEVISFKNINEMILIKNNSMASFTRYDDTPKPVTRNPF